ncbi:MAG TPA: hypothetical protein VFQ58_07515 [Flavisolibacter sp.]|nr:hypothetical protein [Flavisolibacter sp.]
MIDITCFCSTIFYELIVLFNILTEYMIIDNAPLLIVIIGLLSSFLSLFTMFYLLFKRTKYRHFKKAFWYFSLILAFSVLFSFLPLSEKIQSDYIDKIPVTILYFIPLVFVLVYVPAFSLIFSSYLAKNRKKKYRQSGRRY